MKIWEQTILSAIAGLEVRGFTVSKSDFPPSPLPALYMVNGREMTERQMVNLSYAEIDLAIGYAF